MYCTVCGATISDGQQVCTNCGTAVSDMGYGDQQIEYEQPQQMTYNQQRVYPQQMAYNQQGVQPQQMTYNQQGVQPQQMTYNQQAVQSQQMAYNQQASYGQPQTGGFNFQKNTMFNLDKVLGWVAGLLLILAPLFNWISFSLRYNYSSMRGEADQVTANLFKLASENNGLDGFEDLKGCGVFAFIGIMFILMGIITIWLNVSISNNFKARFFGSVSSEGLFMFVMGLSALTLFIITCYEPLIYTIVSAGKEQFEKLKEYDGITGHNSHGLGATCALIGSLLILFSAVCKLLGKRFNKGTK